jgi:ubiquinone/menaquinone biosynthesis C-methylase UbiE
MARRTGRNPDEQEVLKSHGSEYVLGTNDAELIRLGFQHRVWSREAADIWERAGFAPGMTILDVGSGPGFVSLDLSTLVGPTGRVLAVDESSRFIDHLRSRAAADGASNIEARTCDVQSLELPANSVDGAYSRWVLCFVPDPEAVIAGVATALRKGGAFAVQDYLFYRALRLLPGGGEMEKVVNAVEEAWRARGGDPEICRRLPSLMAKHGLSVREARPIVRVARPGSALWEWPGSFFRNFLPVLVASGYLSEPDRAAFEREWMEHTADPIAMLSTPILMDLIAVKP